MENKKIIIDDIYALIYYDNNFVPYIKTCLVKDTSVHLISENKTLLSDRTLGTFKNLPHSKQKAEIILQNDTMPVEIVKFGSFGLDLYYSNKKPFFVAEHMPKINLVPFSALIEKSLKCKLVNSVGITDKESIVRYEKRYNKALQIHYNKRRKLNSRANKNQQEAAQKRLDDQAKIAKIEAEQEEMFR